MTKPAEMAVRAGDKVSSESRTLEELLDIQKAAFLRDGIPDARTRIDRINRLGQMLLDHSDELTAALTADFGTRPADLSVAADIAGCMIDIAHQRRSAEKWMQEVTVNKLQGLVGFKQRLRRDPLGVVGIMGPWNFPLQLTIVPAASAFAAGNRVLIRPSSVTAKTTDVIARVAPDYFSIEELAVITSKHGGGSDFAKLKVDHMFFTGSPEVGSSVAQEAAKNLVPVTLELGGKNPVVVDKSYDIAKAATSIADSRMVNGGQVCLCPDYVFVPEDKVGEFTDKVMARWTKNFPTIVDNDDYTSTINEKNYNRIVDLIDDAVNLGATKHQLKPAGEELPNAGARKIPPTILTGVTPGMKIEDDEVFGPVLTVYPYRDLSEAIDKINSAGHPLTLYWFGEDNDNLKTVADNTRSGSISGNDFGLHMLSSKLPFGGVGRSGMGNYHGEFGFNTFSHARAVTVSKLPMSFAENMVPPFGKREKRATSIQMKLWRFLNGRAMKKSAKKR
ncbi:MAG: aldehyde dehydrogenase family protein [Gordonia sp. (in: high G+C Gram-positive bacteria)]|uniref:aldehyde dehydrogenase family protein n=1 Tax=Gordonia sp. (in: high G+C Gram-positive bacteria) TaxID=84139 RepID=UPI003C74D1C7